MAYERILKPTNINPLVAHALKRHDGYYHFRLTRTLSTNYIKRRLQQDTWDSALHYHNINLQSPGFVAKTQKELVEMVYQEVLKTTGSGETAMNTPIFLFNQDKGRWQMTLPKWPGPRFYDRTYLSGLTGLDYGHFHTFRWYWGECFISKLARERDLRLLIKRTQQYQDSDDRVILLRDFVERILSDMPNRKDGFVGHDYNLEWDDNDKLWRNK